MSFALSYARLNRAVQEIQPGRPRNLIVIERGDLWELLEDWRRLDEDRRRTMWLNSP